MPLSLSSSSLTTPRRTAVTIQCGQRQLVGTLYSASGPATHGCIVLVGGPQYRVGSHRQFVEFADQAATAGIHTLTFDFSGMGDSEGSLQSYAANTSQISKVVDHFLHLNPSVRHLSLFGLCDGASAAILYAGTDSRIESLALINPWLESPKLKARARIRYYYLRRVFSRDFWSSLLWGKVKVSSSLTEFFRVSLRSVAADRSANGQLPSPDTLASKMAAFAGSCLIVISGKDITGTEFFAYAKQNPLWQRASDERHIAWLPIEEADHTLSQKHHQQQAFAALVAHIKGQVS